MNFCDNCGQRQNWKVFTRADLRYMLPQQKLEME